MSNILPINCIRCHRVFQPIADEKICSRCHEESENVFHSIKDYLYEHPGASAAIVANVLDIPVKIIKYYLREGRLEVAGEANSFFTCEKCGVPIKSGHFCDSCEKGSNVDRSKDKTLLNSDKTIGKLNDNKFTDKQDKSEKDRLKYKSGKFGKK